jgi:hypothetical protein
MANGPIRRAPIGELGLDAGKKARLHNGIWQREHDESLRFAARLRELLEKYPS